MTLRARRVDREGTFSGNKPERAIIDIGSNTVRMVIFGGSPRAPSVLFNEKVAARLGRDIATTGLLPGDAMDMALRELWRFAMLIEVLGIKDVETVATAAVRDAANGAQFLEEIARIGLEPRLISGTEEARLSAQGVIGAFPGARGVVADLGGGSLELVRIGKGGVEHATSLPLGTLRLGEYRDGDEPAMVRRLADRLVQAGWGSAIEAPLYLVGGTWRAIAVHDMARRKYPLSDPHGYELDAGRTAKLAARIAAAAPERLLIDSRISIMRSEIMPDAAVLLEAMLETLMPERIVFSSWGLREGLLYDRLPDHTRAQDPLLAGVAIFAAQCGAPPVLASHIAGWTADVAPSRAAGAERIRLAANMLALASMQLEPNLRLDHAVDWALHKRWIALDAAGRAMIAAAVAANRNVADRPKGLERLASQEELDEAISWGLATRLARRLGARSRQSLQVSRLTADNGALVLRLRDSHSNLFSLANERDMAALAEHMGLRAELRLVPDGEAL